MLGEFNYYDYDHRSYDRYTFGIVLPLVVWIPMVFVIVGYPSRSLFGRGTKSMGPHWKAFSLKESWMKMVQKCPLSWRNSSDWVNLSHRSWSHCNFPNLTVPTAVQDLQDLGSLSPSKRYKLSVLWGICKTCMPLTCLLLGKLHSLWGTWGGFSNA